MRIKQDGYLPTGSQRWSPREINKSSNNQKSETTSQRKEFHLQKSKFTHAFVRKPWSWT